MSSFMSNVLVGDSWLNRSVIQPVLNFAARFYVGYVFFASGVKKIDDNFMVNAKTLNSFREDFKVPYLPPEYAANLATYAELFLPLLLILGFLSRPTALALFILNSVALYSLHTAGWANPVSNWQHIFWGALLLMIFVYGPSKVAIDSCISEKLRGNKSSLIMTIIGIVILSGIGYFLLHKFLL